MKLFFLILCSLRGYTICQDMGLLTRTMKGSRRGDRHRGLFYLRCQCDLCLTANAKDLELIRFLYEHHTLTRKRVVWVLTAIDKAMDLNIENEPSWKETLAANNDYLRQNFTHQDGRPDTAFIGPASIPVSPALEAQGRYLISANDEARGHTLIAASYMDDLRMTLKTVIAQGAGQRHLADIAAEASAIIVPRQRVIGGRLNAERLPFKELTAEQEAIEEQLNGLDRIVAETRNHLEALLVQRVRTAARPFGKARRPSA